jgi:ankyrin repeat protein
LPRTILYGVERYVRNVAEDLRDIHEVIKNNETKLDRLDREQNKHFKQASNWQEGTTTSLKRIREDEGITYEEVKRVRREQEDCQCQTILDWITPIEYAPQQHDFITRRQEETGQWLLDSAEFQAWLKTDKQTLFCPGIPGAGKTILTSIVVDELTAQFSSDPTIGIAYIYCNFRRQEEQKIDDLLASLLKQLAESQPSLPVTLKELYDRHKTKRTRPFFDEVSRSLQVVTMLYSRVFIIVDALDECQISDGCRQRFLTGLFNLQEKCGVNLFATSRPLSSIEKEFEGNLKLEIRASEGDVRRYLEGRMLQLPGFVAWSLELKEETKTDIINAVDGMYVVCFGHQLNHANLARFLLAQLYLESLTGKRSPKAVRAALKNLVTGSGAYDRAYEDAMERINGQVKDQEELAKQVLSWITCAKRPLTTSELQHALGVEVGESELDEENLSQIEDIVSVCAGLVTVDAESGIIRLVHYTTQEYFERTQKRWFPNAETDITTICVTYLSFNAFQDDVFALHIEISDREVLEVSAKYPLLPYTAQYWGYHACRGPERNILDLIFNFLENKSKLVCFLMHTLNYRYGASGRRSMTDTPKLQIAAQFGLKETVKALLEGGADVEARSSDGWTALNSAAWMGQEAVVDLLLEGEADIEARTESGWTALANASRNEHLGVVCKLLAEGADIETQTDKGWTPLRTAVFHRHEPVICFSLERGADIESKADTGWTALLTAALYQREAVIRLLLHKGANIEATTSWGWTSLDQVARRGDNILTKLLLENGASFDTKSKDGCTPLMKAAESGDERTVQLLLQAGADKDTKDTRGKTAYDKAAHIGKTVIMRLLNNNTI